MKFMNREQRRNKKVNKVAKWIVDSILKLNDENLLEFYKLIEKELEKRGIVDVRSCTEFFN